MKVLEPMARRLPRLLLVLMLSGVLSIASADTIRRVAGPLPSVSMRTTVEGIVSVGNRDLLVGVYRSWMIETVGILDVSDIKNEVLKHNVLANLPTPYWSDVPELNERQLIQYVYGWPFVCLLETNRVSRAVGPGPAPIVTTSRTLLVRGLIGNAVACTAVVSLIHWAFSATRARRRRSSELCSQCGYPWGRQPICPECGSDRG